MVVNDIYSAQIWQCVCMFLKEEDIVNIETTLHMGVEMIDNQRQQLNELLHVAQLQNAHLRQLVSFSPANSWSPDGTGLLALASLGEFFCCVIYESNTAELGSVFGMAQKLGLVTIKTIIMVNFPEIVDQLIQHITPILKSLHWLKVSERIEYKIFSLTYKILSTTQPLYLYDLISIQPPHGYNTRSSSYVTLIKPSSSLRVTQRSFRHASPHLWNQLPTSLRIPHPNYSSPLSDSFEHASLSWYTLLSPSITFSLFHSELKTYLFLKSYPLPYSVSVCRTDLMALDCSPDLFAHRFYILVLFFCFSYF